MRRFLILLPLLAMTACGAPQPKVTPEQSAALIPADGHIAALYATSCRNCHTVAASGAPLAGDSAAWAPRVKQGADVLLTHTVQGFRAMPAGGQCAACTAADYQALIAFMSKGA